jgi:hypothetical protein
MPRHATALKTAAPVFREGIRCDNQGAGYQFSKAILAKRLADCAFMKTRSFSMQGSSSMRVISSRTF